MADQHDDYPEGFMDERCGAFFGTSFIKAFAYGIAYVVMFVICTFIYGKLIAVTGSRQTRTERAKVHDVG